MKLNVSESTITVTMRRVGDCAIRAVAAAEGLSWDEAFDQLAAYGKKLGNIQNSNEAIEASFEADPNPHIEKLWCNIWCNTIKNLSR